MCCPPRTVRASPVSRCRRSSSATLSRQRSAARRPPGSPWCLRCPRTPTCCPPVSVFNLCADYLCADYLSRIRSVLRVVAGAPPVDDDDGFVADHPGVVAGGQRGYLPGRRIERAAIGQLDPQCACHVVLEMRRLAQVGARDRLDVLGPPPPRLEDEPSDVAAPDAQQL